MPIIKRSTKGAPLTHAEMDGNWDAVATKSGTMLTDTLTVNVDALVVSSEKQVGIGVIPAASTIKMLQVAKGSIAAADKDVYFSSNAYYGGVWKYIGNGYATQMWQDSGIFAWRNAVSGAAGGVISWVERMRIDSAGNVGIGMTGQETGVVNGFLFQPPSGLGGLTSYVSSTSARDHYTFKNGVTAGPASGTTVGAIGTVGACLYIKTGGTERLRLDENGNLLVGVTSGAGKLTVGIDSSVNPASQFRDSRTGPIASSLMNFYRNSVLVGYISTTDVATAYNTTSDHRLKEDVKPITDALAVVARLKPYNFKWRNKQARTNGFIAHELAEVVPEAVTGERDAVDVDGGPIYQAVDHSKLIPLLVAAVQQLKAEIDKLKGGVT